ncbi:MAG: hypothetical protein Ct9H300mP3_08210 [Gammaproteobacteria bacterium]|nr:MAG: hypothetical protein Ct9H300mP3_08210 [Gammaproteobacteria bacterium]
MIDLSLEGKKAVFTGASLGIGAAVVKMLADQGASVTFWLEQKILLKNYQNIRLKGMEPLRD